MSGSVDDRDLAALGPSLPRPRSGRGKAGPWGKRGRPFRGDQRAPGLLRACLSPGSLSFWDGEQPAPSLQFLGSREEVGRGEGAAAELSLGRRRWALERRGRTAPGPCSCARRRLQTALRAGLPSHLWAPRGWSGLSRPGVMPRGSLASPGRGAAEDLPSGRLPAPQCAPDSGLH